MADLTPTAAMAEAAARGLRLHDEGKSGDGLKPETVRRANIIARRDELTESHVREMRAWFARHESDKRPGWADPGDETPGFVAWLLWGGDPAESWSNRKVAEMDREQEGRSVERRGLTSPVELREENGQPRLFGYAALYEAPCTKFISNNAFAKGLFSASSLFLKSALSFGNNILLATNFMLSGFGVASA